MKAREAESVDGERIHRQEGGSLNSVLLVRRSRALAYSFLRMAGLGGGLPDWPTSIVVRKSRPYTSYACSLGLAGDGAILWINPIRLMPSASSLFLLSAFACFNLAMNTLGGWLSLFLWYDWLIEDLDFWTSFLASLTSPFGEMVKLLIPSTWLTEILESVFVLVT